MASYPHFLLQQLASECSAQPEAGLQYDVAVWTDCNAGLMTDRATSILLLNVPLLLSHCIYFFWEGALETGLQRVSGGLQLPL